MTKSTSTPVRAPLMTLDHALVQLLAHAHPLNSVETVSTFDADGRVLAQALAKGGSTLNDFSNADGQTGYFQLEAMVYDRAGLPCKACGGPIKGIRQGQRSTFFCVTCQKP